MADNTVLPTGSGGDTIRDVNKAGVIKTQVVIVDMGGGGAEDLVSVPVKDGAPITGQTLEAGGASNQGWLSSIRKAITDRLGTLGQKAMAASTPVVIASDQSAVPVTANQGVGLAQTSANAWPVIQPDVNVTGTIIALNGSVTINTAGVGTVGVLLSGTWVATAQFQGSVDGTTWANVNAEPVPSGALISAPTVNGQWMINAGGYKQVRVTASAFTSGTINVTLEGNQIQHAVKVHQLTASNLNAIVTQGPAGAAGWPVRTGTANTLGAVGSVAAPAATTAVATIAAPAAGTYQIDVKIGYSGATAETTVNNMQLQAGASVITALMHGGTVGDAANQLTRGIIWTLDGATALTVNAIGAALAGTIYAAQITATKVS